MAWSGDGAATATATSLCSYRMEIGHGPDVPEPGRSWARRKSKGERREGLRPGSIFFLLLLFFFSKVFKEGKNKKIK